MLPACDKDMRDCSRFPPRLLSSETRMTLHVAHPGSSHLLSGQNPAMPGGSWLLTAPGDSTATAQGQVSHGDRAGSRRDMVSVTFGYRFPCCRPFAKANTQSGAKPEHPPGTYFLHLPNQHRFEHLYVCLACDHPLLLQHLPSIIIHRYLHELFL